MNIEQIEKLLIDYETKLMSSIKNILAYEKDKLIQSMNNDFGWTKWTVKSNDVLFKSSRNGIGDGEEKLACELDSKVLGQNSKFDMKIIIEGNEYDCEIKKLDSNTFNTGVIGRNNLRPIKYKIFNLFQEFKIISKYTYISETEKLKLQHFSDVSEDELCCSNISRLYDICSLLNIRRKYILSTLPNVNMTILSDENIVLSLYDYYKISLITKQCIPNEYLCFIDKLNLLNHLSHDYIINPYLLKQSLDELIFMFSKLKIIFVDEKKGYNILYNINKLIFERITRGCPRFRLTV